MSIKENIYQLIDEDKGNNKADAYVNYFIFGLIIMNVIAVFFESYDQLNPQYKVFLHWFELFSVLIFTIEYLLRIWTADLKYTTVSSSKARLKFIFSTYGIIDLIAIIPFILPLITKLDLRV